MANLDIKTKFKLFRSPEGFPEYASTNLRIPTKKGGIVPFNLNRAQLRVWQIIAILISLNLPVRLFVVKARQLGFTTLFSAILYWLTTLNKNRRAISVAHDLPAAHNVGERYKSYYFRSLKELRPRFKQMNREKIHFATPIKDMDKTADNVDMGLDSYLFVHTADSEEIGRSYTYQYALLTEFCQWPNIGIDVKSRLIALNQALPEDAGTHIYIESTAQGENYAFEFWNRGLTLDQILGKSPIDPDKENNGYLQIFVSWLADDQYRRDFRYDEHYFELSDLPDSHYGDELTERENILNELRFWYPQESNDSSWLNHESMCRLKWRRFMIDTKCEGDKYAFKKEYPTTVIDAFGVSNKSVFKAERLIELSERIKSNKIEPEKFRYHHDDEIKDYRQKFAPTKHGHLRVYRLPNSSDERFVCGADASQGGPDSDDSAVVILSLPSLTEVASFNDKIQPAEFAGVLNYLCALYNFPLLGLERNDKGGYAALEFLIKFYRYPNLYYHIDPFAIKLNSEVKYGWITNEVTRGILISDGQKIIDNMDSTVNSKEIVDQLKTFVENPKTKKVAAVAGKKDDLVIAYLIALQMAKQIHIKPSKLPSNPRHQFNLERQMERAMKTTYGNNYKRFKRHYAA